MSDFLGGVGNQVLVGAAIAQAVTEKKENRGPGAVDQDKIDRAAKSGVVDPAQIQSAQDVHDRIEGVMRGIGGAGRDPISAAKAQITLLGLEQKRMADRKMDGAVDTQKELGESLIYEIRRLILAGGEGVSDAERAAYDAVLNEGRSKVLDPQGLRRMVSAAESVIAEYETALRSIPAYRKPEIGRWRKIADALGEDGRATGLDNALKAADLIRDRATAKLAKLEPGPAREAVELGLQAIESAHADLVLAREGKLKESSWSDLVKSAVYLAKGIERLLDHLG
jgi:hypothetical protein